MSQIFEKNIKALLEKKPELATKLFALKTHNDFEVVQQGNDPINLNIIDKKRNYPIYETQPLDEIQKKQQHFKEKYERYPVLFFFGMGNGIFIKLLFANSSLKKVFVFEPNLEILYIAFHIVDFSEEILNEKLEIFLPQEFTFAKAMRLFSHKDVQLFAKTFELHIYSNYYEKFYSNTIIEINKLLIRAIKQTITNFGNDTIDTLIGIEHHINNIPTMLKNPYFSQLENKKNTDVAIIVSTGPSLAKQLPLLKKIQNHATLICIDASMPILAKHGIVPDFVTSLERVQATAKFFKNTPPKFQKNIIMLHASLQHKDVLKYSKGKKILPMRPFRHTKYFKLDKFGYLGIGMSAANMAYELAYFMKYKTIVLIGQDLAYSEDGKSHSEGHVFGANQVKHKPTDEYVTKYGGNGVIKTTRVWNMFRNFFEKDIEDAKEQGVTTINATEGGARIHGAIEMPFSEVVEKYIDTSKNKKEIKLRTLSDNTINKLLLKSHKKIETMVNYGQKVQSKIEKVFLQVAKECEKLAKLKDENKLEEIDYEKLLKLSNKIDKIKDIIETERFSLIFGETIESYLVNKELDLAKIMVRPSNTEIEKKAKLIEWIMQHKEWLFMLAGSINAQIIVVKRAVKNLERELKKRNLQFNKIK
ncbi:motility accessory factor [Nautilia profundicola AmH]|uniref:Motility accessory factor n=1 Tax=Nautilia profundicola (strain ATCC BAA-1463 / DSM 18972 / AmH) TaxID=598659 RepID=B9L6K9_NAUPA|nr:motility associated factor glycosyltransferase family protein [Nautilia profundicola]ACM92477.1 motility accessory factor [Nautilia profundicola AmH]